MYEIRQVKTKQEWKDFIDLPWSIYKNDRNWVPPLKISVREILDVKKNPFFQHAYLYPLVAYQDGDPVGRIVGIIDENHNKTFNEKTGFFGFFESVDDPQLSQALFDKVNEWCRSWGMERLRGPMNPSTNGEFGLLVDGYDDPPMVLTTYNPKYYVNLFKTSGFEKSMDTFAYYLDPRIKFSDRVLKHVERVKERRGITFRTIDRKNFEKDVLEILSVYDDAWEDNWGFVRMTENEKKALVKELKLIYDPNLVLVVEVRGEVAGFGLALPDANEVIKKVKHGRLTPVAILKLLWFLKGPGRKKIKRLRVYGLGFKKKFERLGLGPILYMEFFKRGSAMGYETGEASWVLENNVPMNKALQEMGTNKFKTWRVFDRAVL